LGGGIEKTRYYILRAMRMDMIFNLIAREAAKFYLWGLAFGNGFR
jgi:hypothetical protein